jgi:hypothetical protein
MAVHFNIKDRSKESSTVSCVSGDRRSKIRKQSICMSVKVRDFGGQAWKLYISFLTVLDWPELDHMISYLQNHMEMLC